MLFAPHRTCQVPIPLPLRLSPFPLASLNEGGSRRSLTEGVLYGSQFKYCQLPMQEILRSGGFVPSNRTVYMRPLPLSTL